MRQLATGPARDARQGPGRRDGIDFWRGLVLCFIFINHIPGNIFEGLTPKNYGFSDSAEAFVFLSGVSLAFAYAQRFGDGRAGQVLHVLQWRVVKLYGIHIFLSLAAIAIYALGATFGHDDALLDVHGRDLFVDDPWAALVGTLSLGHQIGYFNILPLYIVLIAMLTAQLFLARRGPWPMLAVATLFYGLVRVTGWNVPTWPMKGTWFFNPLAWQLLMAMGLASALLLKDGRLPRHPLLLTASAVIVLASAFSVTNGLSFRPGLQDWTRGWADLDKTSLGMGRLVHFAALAYLLHGFRVAARCRGWRVYAPLCLLGRHSLTVFSVLSLLAAAGQVLTELLGQTILLDIVLIGGGFAVLYGVARLSEAWTVPALLARTGNR